MREKHQASQAGKDPTAKTPRSIPSTITHTIHQQVNEQSSTVAGAFLSVSPSASSAHLVGVLICPLWGMGYHQWTSCQHSGGLVPLGPPLPQAQYYQKWPPLPPLVGPTSANTALNNQNLGVHQWQQSATQAYQPPVASYSSASQDSPGEQNGQQDQLLVDPLVNALAVLTVPGKQPEATLSMHVSQSIKKCIWAGEYIDLAYLLETNLVPEDEKSYEFACTFNSNNKLSLTTAKPKAKIESYNAWNKAFRVLREVVVLCDPSQCLPMVQYAAKLNDNIGKFTFLVTYQYDMKFWLKKQIKPSTPWNVIDNHLWSKCFSGTAKDNYHPNQ